MALFDDTFEEVSLQDLITRLKKLENLVDILMHNQDLEDAKDTRAS